MDPKSTTGTEETGPCKDHPSEQGCGVGPQPTPEGVLPEKERQSPADEKQPAHPSGRREGVVSDPDAPDR